MDSISGSLKDSDPTSPVSPSSPDPAGRNKATSPVTILQALSSLNVTKDESSCGGLPVMHFYGLCKFKCDTQYLFSSFQKLFLRDSFLHHP